MRLLHSVHSAQTPLIAAHRQVDSGSTRRDVSYVSQMYTGGEPCDITGATRETEVRTFDFAMERSFPGRSGPSQAYVGAGPFCLWREQKRRHCLDQGEQTACTIPARVMCLFSC